MATYDENNNPYSWMPGFLRRFLNLTYDESQGSAAGQSGPSYTSSQSPASAPRATWSAPSEPTFKASNMEGYRAPGGSVSTGGYTPPPPVQQRPQPSNAATSAPPVQLEGYIQPITYLLRGYMRGALPPQGLEIFTKETRATTTDVWNLYSHWIRFQTEEAFRFGREMVDTLTEASATASSSTTSAPARRIKVTVANGNGNGHTAPAAEAPATEAPAAEAPAAEAPAADESQA